MIKQEKGLRVVIEETPLTQELKLNVANRKNSNNVLSDPSVVIATRHLIISIRPLLLLLFCVIRDSGTGKNFIFVNVDSVLTLIMVKISSDTR